MHALVHKNGHNGDSMDCFMQNSRPSYPPMSMSSEDNIRELLEDASQLEIAQNFNNYMSPSWPDQSIETPFEGNFNNSYNQDWRMHQDFSMSYDETNAFEKPTSSSQAMFNSFEQEKKELIEMCKDIVKSSRDLLSEMVELKEGNARLQEKIEETSQEKEEMREEFEKKLQLMKKVEGENALEMEKANKLQELNKKLIFEVKTLRVDKGMLLKKNGEVLDKNKELELQIERLEAKKNEALKELQDLARSSKEWEDEVARKSRKMQMEVELKINALEEVKEVSNKNKYLEVQIERLEVERNSASKEFEDLAKLLELTKKTELDHLAELAKAKQEIEAMMMEAIQLPKEERLNISQGDSSAEVKKPSANKAKRRKAKRRVRTLHLHLQQRPTNKVSFLTLSLCATIAIR